jgi:hypothetical protein
MMPMMVPMMVPMMMPPVVVVMVVVVVVILGDNHWPLVGGSIGKRPLVLRP